MSRYFNRRIVNFVSEKKKNETTKVPVERDLFGDNETLPVPYVINLANGKGVALKHTIGNKKANKTHSTMGTRSKCPADFDTSSESENEESRHDKSTNSLRALVEQETCLKLQKRLEAFDLNSGGGDNFQLANDEVYSVSAISKRQKFDEQEHEADDEDSCASEWQKRFARKKKIEQYNSEVAENSSFAVPDFQKIVSDVWERFYGMISKN